MKILLDTHALIWFTEGHDRLSNEAKSEIGNIHNEKFVSIASLWEIVIKSSKNKLELKQSFVELNQFLAVNDINLVPVEVNHLTILLSLPYHHSDPFDRLIIAQAITENLTIISADRHFAAYPMALIW